LPETTDVLDVLTQQIEEKFAMSLPELRRAVTAAPHANPRATEVMRWHGHLQEAQAALEQAEDDLIKALDPEPALADDQMLDLAHRVDTAVTARDGRAMVVRYLMDSTAIGNRPAARHAARGQALRTSRPPRVPPTTAAPARGAVR
jgi:tetrahydromethanopterin S-methyltransferase subunit B